MPAKYLELKHTIKLISEIFSQIDEVETEIKSIMDDMDSPIMSIPGISYRMGATIITEIEPKVNIKTLPYLTPQKNL